MTNSRPLPLWAVASAFLCSAVALAQHVTPAVRILNPVDETSLVTLSHTVHPLANAANDRGAAPDGMRLDRIQLTLQRSPGQETALRQLIAQIHTPGSPNYHQWLTPDQFGAQFGPSDQDVATIESWLGSHGFTVSKVNPGKGTLEFSGSVAQMRDAFHTRIHKYVVNGEAHFANANDPQIPAALAPVIGGFASLNNFHPRPYLQKLGKASFNPTTHEVTPQWTWGNSSGVYFVLAPGDFAVQYDLQPLYAANVNGAGQTIAIVNESNINVDLVNQFRTLFNLPANPPQVIIDGNDPGIDGINNPDGANYASVEAYLDVEWAGAVAPNATIDLVIAADTSLESGLILAMEHAVYGNVAPVISLSFGQCESGLGSTNSFLNGLWEQAAAQGQTVMVSSGDNGSAGCDNDNTQEYAVSGQAVNGFASTPYNVAVGGTDFFYTDYARGAASISNYWNKAASQLPAVSIQGYIPEQPWNDSQYGLNAYNQYTATASTSIVAGSGGASNAAVCAAGYNTTSGACNGTLAGYPKPSWQTGVGVPNDGVRDLPDVSLFAANGDNFSFYPICATDGDCQTSGLGAGGLVQIYGVGGTSASSPAFAGIMALVNEKWGRQGQAGNILYALKAQHPADFHDITVGTNSVPCQYSTTASLSSPDCIAVANPAKLLTGVTEGEIGTGVTPEYNAAPGYNPATGLGTIDANNLVNDWNKISLASTTTTFTFNNSSGGTTFPHGTSVTIGGTVTGSSPTGNVALMTDSTEPIQQNQGVFALTSGSYSSSTVNYLPGGTYHIWGQYSGDAINKMSTSAPPLQITVTPETPGMDFNLFNKALGQYYTSAANSSPGTQVDYGSQLVLSAMVAPASQVNYLQSCDVLGTNCNLLGSFTTPTGTVTFTDGSTPIGAAVMNAEGDAELNAAFGVGSHSVNATYSGDQSYNAISSSTTTPAAGPIAFTVIKDTPQFFWNASNVNASGQIVSGQPTVFNAIVENYAQYNVVSTTGSVAPVPVLPPTGTVTLSSTPAGISGATTLSAGVDPADDAQAGIGAITLASSLAAGSYTVTFTYSGDNNYLGGSASGTITVAQGSGLAASTITASMSGAISPNSTVTVTGAVTGSGTTAPTGGVIVFSSGYSLTGSSSIPFSSSSGDVSSFSFAISSQDILQGSNFITLQYTGDSRYAPSEYTLNGGSPIANPLADFSLVPNSTIVPVSISGGANTGTDTINIASVNGFNGKVDLSCAGTTPVTCSPATPVSLSNGSSTASTLTINIPASTPNGNYDVVVTGKDDATNLFVHTLAITAQVSGSGPAFTLTNSGKITVAQGNTITNSTIIFVTPSGGFTGTVNLSCAVTSAPAGASNPLTCAPSSANLNPTSFNITGPGAPTSTLTINTTSATTTGNYQITITAASGSLVSSTVVNVTVNLPADFLLSASSDITVNAGATTGNTTGILSNALGSFNGSISLTCAVTSAPTGAANPVACNSSNLNPVTLVPPGTPQSTLTVTTTTNTTTGAYVITVTGNSGPITHTATVNVTVNAAAASAYTVSATSPSGSISPGSPAASTVTVAGSGGYTGSVTLTCSLTGGPSNQSGDAPGCSITGGSLVALSAGTTSGQATATVTTTAATADLVYPKMGNGRGWLGAGSGAILALLIFFGIPARRRSWRSMLGILIAMAVIGALSSCGGGNSGGGGGGTNPTNPGTTAGTYTFTITSSGTPAIMPAPTTTFTVSVN